MNKTDLLEDILDMDRKFIRRPYIKIDDDEGTYHEWLTARDYCRYMPIHLAAQFGSVEVFRILWELSLPNNMKHLKPGYDGNDRTQILLNTSFDNRTRDGRFGALFLLCFLKKENAEKTEMFWTLQSQMDNPKSFKSYSKLLLYVQNGHQFFFL